METIVVLVVRRETPGAFQVVTGGGNRPIVWLPKYAVENADRFKAGDRDVAMTIPYRLWLEKMAELRDPQWY